MSTTAECAYTMTGKGPAIFLVHGIGARRAGWNRIVERLAGRFTCIAYDLRGHGESSQPEGIMTLDDLVADLEALRARLDISAAHVVGHSLGGMIGPAYARAHPERTLSLGLLSTAAFRTPDDSAKVRGVVATMRKNGIANTLDTLTSRWFTDAFAAAHPETIAARKRQVLETPADVFLNVFDIYANTEMSPWLADITQPALVLAGSDDAGCNPRLNAQIASAMPNARLQILDGLKHAIMIEAPDRVADALEAFLAKYPL